ncbi:hypothetical protein [Bacillus sp. 165]|uniref:hypothetical protein n=1 Tax=Bacillus sp. 165 TaxID=1529117 RepID=UPI001ADA760F|nr:hypothetical protein [Bacillus sp. 165]MBO9129354.1 hypothetical protein [Bacillus sp. 165]
MSSVKSTLMQIIKDIHSENPAVRYNALSELQDLKEMDFEVNLFLLEKLIEEAAAVFPEAVGEWDDPSFHMIDLVSQFIYPELIESMKSHFDGFSMYAKERAIRYLCEFEEETVLVHLLDILRGNLNKKEIILPLDVLFERPAWVAKIVEQFYEFLKDERYKFDFYRMLAFCLENKYLGSLKPGFVLPVLLQDYQAMKKTYNEYEAAYHPKYVYGSWKATYIPLRTKMELLLSLMVFYYNEEIQKEIQEALLFADPVIKTASVSVCLQRGISIDENHLIECASNLETSETVYWELLRINMENRFPIKQNKQHYFVKSHLFHHVLGQQEFVLSSEKIEIKETLNITNSYGQPIRYYLVTFIDEIDSIHGAWVGAYATEEDEDSIYMWDGTYVIEENFHDYSVEGHIQRFMEQREKEREEMQSFVHYQRKIGNILIQIKGDEFLYFDGEEQVTVKLHEIKQISIKMVKTKGFLFKRNVPTVTICTRYNESVITFPVEYIDYDEFAQTMEELTRHLEDYPYIERIKE